jgi:colanic acid/amylovoran biosynthesis glycosyltransferase
MHLVLNFLLLFVIQVSNIYSLNILFVTGYFPHISQQFIQEQIVQFIRNGHNVRIHSFQKPKHDKVQKDVTEYDLLRKTMYGKQLPQLSLFDVVYVQFGYHGQQVVEEARAKGFAGPIVVCFRGNDLSGYLKRNIHRYDRLFKQADLFLPVCAFFKDRLVDLGCDESKTVVHHSAINLDKFLFKKHVIDSTKQLRLISVCRLTEKKGLEYAVKAVAVLKKKYPRIIYTIVGDADTANCSYKNYIQQLVVDLGLEKNVFFYGWATHEEIVKMLDRSDIFLLPSITAGDGDQEGIANALKEAMAAGVPVVATDHAGTAELVAHEQTGLLIEEKDVLGIVKAVYWYSKHPEEVKKIAKQARIKIEEEFAIGSTVTKLEKIFEELLAKKGSFHA